MSMPQEIIKFIILTVDHHPLVREAEFKISQKSDPSIFRLEIFKNTKTKKKIPPQLL